MQIILILKGRAASRSLVVRGRARFKRLKRSR